MIQQHRLELVFAGPREPILNALPVAMAAMSGNASCVHVDAIDLNELAHKVGAVAELNWEHRAEIYNILPHEHGFRVAVSQTFEAFDQETMKRIRARCQQIFCQSGRWRGRLVAVEILARLPPTSGAENQTAPASA